MSDPYSRIDAILDAEPVSPSAGSILGRSRDGRPVPGFRFGDGPTRVSVIAGCHADEPVGPRLLRHLCGFLESVPGTDPLLAGQSWWIVPHINPDGEARNRVWYDDGDARYDIARYLRGVVREPPGDDIEFGFPRGPEDHAARPEPRAVYDWWRSDPRPFAFHATLHGIAFAAGPWFLVEPAWRDRLDHLRGTCTGRVAQLGYDLHDVERRGEKGFVRLGRGFCTRPDSDNMRRFFENAGDPVTAERFRPSSMETVRAGGGDALTVVSEMPLFITPGVGQTLGPPDPVAERWKTRINGWREIAGTPGEAARVRREAVEAGLVPMPVRDQMVLQWTLVVAGIEQAALKS